MIISASRRTDIPAFYSQWLIHRIDAGFVKTKNPFNRAQVREISLAPADVDAFVFWTKNPGPMLPALARLDTMGYPYYFQFTLTPYGPELETGLPPKEEIIRTFQTLGDMLGRHRVIWRYDPIILNEGWDIPRHIDAFGQLCYRLAPYTGQVVFSFVDLYSKVKTDQIRAIAPREMKALAKDLAAIARAHDLSPAACCEALDFTPYGIQPSACIDKNLIQRLTGKPLSVKADPGQRPGCGCVQSVDIGVYNTCLNGCIYCYANHSPASTRRNLLRHDPKGAFLIE